MIHASETLGIVPTAARATHTHASHGGEESAGVIDPKEVRHFPLVEKVSLTHNTNLYRFALPDPNVTLGLPIGQHLWLYADIGGEPVMRSYTPTSGSEARGHFDLVIKVYPAGKMSRHVDSLRIGDSIAVKGPKGRFKYATNMKRALGMICGGTGITPMWQVIRAVLENPREATELRLLYANVGEEDILFRAELDALARAHANFRVRYVLNNPPSGWTGEVGFVTKEMIDAFMPAPAADVQLLMCGPPPMVKALQKHLADAGHAKEAVFAF